jgi:uncharacterized protein
MQIVPLYAAVLALIYIALSLQTTRLRNSLRVSLGDGGDKELMRAIRVHANFAEYVPFAVLLIHLCEGDGAPKELLHGLCIALIIGRVAHAWGVSQLKENLRFRMVGMLITFFTLGIAAAYLLAGSLFKN